MRRSLVGSLLCLVLAWPALAGQTGSLRVVVRVPGGSSVPGAAVTVEGPPPNGRRVFAADAEGVARFRGLAPGAYRVQVDIPGLGSAERDGVVVALDATQEIGVELAGGSVVESVEVTASAPATVVANRSMGLELKRDLVEDLPVGRSYLDRLALVPGVSQTTRPTAHGGTITANQYLIDGVNTLDPVSGVAGIDVNPDIIDHHDVVTGGYLPEYGNVLGLISNIVTRSGGNRWSGRFAFYRRDADWGEDPDNASAPVNQTTSYDSSLSVGGPILRDRLWHFVSFQDVRSKIRGSAEDTSRPPRTTADQRLFGRVTWAVAPAHRIDVLGQYGDTLLTNANSFDVNLTPDQFYEQDEPKYFAAARYTGVLGSRLVLEGHVAYLSLERAVDPQRFEAGPNHGVSGQTRQYGRYATESWATGERLQARADLSWIPEFDRGRHDLKFGAEYQRSRDREYSIPSGGERFADRGAAGATLWSLFGPGANFGPALFARWSGFATYNPGWECRLGGVPCAQQTAAPGTFTDPADWQMTVDGQTYDPRQFAFSTPALNADAAGAGWVQYERTSAARQGAIEPVGQELLALYVNDEWRSGRFALRYGVRAEWQHLTASDGRTIVRFDPTFAPRIGMSLDAAGTGRHMVTAHWGRIYQLLRDNTSSYTGQLRSPYTESQLYAAPVAGYATWSASGGVNTPSGVAAPVLETPYSEEAALTYTGAFGKGTTITLAGVRQRTERIVEDFDPRVGLGNPATYPTLQGEPTLEGLGFADVNGDGTVSPADLPARYVVLNIPGGYREFRGIDAMIEQRLGPGGLVRATYSYADHHGTVTNDGVYLASVGNDPYWDPRLPYNDGRFSYLPEDTYRLYGSYQFRFGLQLGAVLRLQSGVRYGMMNILTPDQGRGVWDGDPAKIVDTLRINRNAFAAYLGIPATLPDGSRNPELDRAITDLVPLDKKSGRGAYEGGHIYTLDLRVGYRFREFRGIAAEVYVDLFNATDVQHVNDYTTSLSTDVAVTTANIGDRSIYRFGRPLTYQSPRSVAAGFRVSF